MDIASLIKRRPVSDIIACDQMDKVHSVVSRLADKRIGAMPVLNEGAVVGIFSERDVIYRLANEGDACLMRPVGEVMTTPAITVSKQTSVDEALSMMTRRRIRHLPVLDGDELIGFVSIGDLVKTRFEEVKHEASALRQYITTG